MTTVRRVVANLKAAEPDDARRFYEDLLGLEAVIDQGWIITFAGDTPSRPQVSITAEGGSGAPVPDLSIEVGDVDPVHARAVELGFEIVRPLRDEPWGVRRFFVRDPFGRTVNILAHG